MESGKEGGTIRVERRTEPIRHQAGLREDYMRAELEMA